MSHAVPPRETLTVVGGRPLARVDSEAVQGAAALLDMTVERLESAARRCLGVQGALVRWAWAPDPSAAPFAPGPDPLEVRAAQAAARLADDVAARLLVRGERVAGCAMRLRLAAGIYRRTESALEMAVGGFVVQQLGPVGALLGLVVRGAQVPLPGSGGPPSSLVGTSSPRSTVSAIVPATVPLGEPAPAATAGAATKVDLRTGANLWRAVAPYVDEAVAGLGWGMGGVTQGASDLSEVVEGLLPASEVEVLPLAAPEAEGGASSPWSDRPSGDVAEALARTADLYPQGSGIVGRPGTGAPAGSLGVEQVTHEDGSTSWTVLIPGTQALLSLAHPFDGPTDLQLMAHETADVSVAVSHALDAAGAGPDEPVVLVGHSLGGIAATALAASPGFRARHLVAGVVTAGAPTATFAVPRGVPVLHLENDEESVSSLDGRSTGENPATADRVTVGRRLVDSADPTDLAASGSISLAHTMPTHLRTLAAARASGNVQVAEVTGRLDRLLDGDRSRTRLFAVRRAVGTAPAAVLAPGPDGLSPSSGRTLR